VASGLTGATAAGRWVGTTVAGAPGAGTFLVGDFVNSHDGNFYQCTTAGSPGTWVTTGGSSSGDFFPVFNVLDFGAVGDGSTDDTAAIAATITAAVNAGGGTIFFGPLANGSPGDYLWKTTITLPVTVAESLYLPGTPPIFISTPLRFTGDTPGSKMPRGDTPTNYTAITFDPATPSFMLQGFGEGSIEIDHLTFNDGSTVANTFFFMTNTVSNIHDNMFIGNASFVNARTDVIHYGGAAATTGNGGATAIFQGYGSKLENNGCVSMRHLAVLQTAANGIKVAGNNMYNTCGTNAADAPIIIAGTAANDVGGCLIEDNTLEMTGVDTSGTQVQTGYAYGISVTWGRRNTFINNGIWDVAGSTSFVAGIIFDSNSQGNIYIEGEREPGFLWATGNVIEQQCQRALLQSLGNVPVITGTAVEIENGSQFLSAFTVDVTTNSSGQATFTFPAAFPNAVASVVGTVNGIDNAVDSRICWVGQIFDVTLSGGTVYIQPEVGSTANQSATFSVSFVAVGS
jgi:hypothetical protein